MASMDALVSMLKEHHYACAPASHKECERLKCLGFPDDAVQFYSLSNGAFLHERVAHGGGWDFSADGRGWRWAILPAEEIKPITQSHSDLNESPLFEFQRFWLPIIDVLDGNYLSLNVAPERKGEVIDCFHETLCDPGYSAIVALSFTSCLEQLLSSDEPFWLKEESRGYGVY